VDEAPVAAAAAQHPIRLVVTDDLRRSRLTVFFRLLLAIPHVIWVLLWGCVALIVSIVNWFATLFSGRSPDALHSFLASYLRYSTHVTAYMFLIADPFPSFSGKAGYPIDIEIAPPEVQNRWTVGFRIILAIPVLLVSNILRNLSQLLAFFSWFIALFLGRVPKGIRDFAAFALRFESQTYAYVFLLTPRYPNFGVSVAA